jgi:predicted dehydrogenase
MDTPLRLGVIGTGSVVREIYQHLYFSSRYSSLIEIVAACDTQEASLNWFSDTWGIAEKARYSDYHELLAHPGLDVVAVNTPDTLHRDPVCDAMRAGIDVIVPKPTAATVADVHDMITTAQKTGRYFGVDFHKRGDPVVREAGARFRRGEYGTLQVGSFFMLDKLLVADPNHVPRFFASADFAAKNSPVSFLTSHMADTLFAITGLYPVSVVATGYKQKLRSLEPIAIDGYDTVDTTITLENGATVHVVTGWILPNSANCLTVQSGKLLFSEASVDLWKEWYGYHEVAHSGITDRNVLFMNFAEEEVSGYGITNPGAILERIATFRKGGEAADVLARRSRLPVESGLLTTLVCECAAESLDRGSGLESGVVAGIPVDAYALLEERIGTDCADRYYHGRR